MPYLQKNVSSAQHNNNVSNNNNNNNNNNNLACIAPVYQRLQRRWNTKLDWRQTEARFYNPCHISQDHAKDSPKLP